MFFAKIAFLYKFIDNTFTGLSHMSSTMGVLYETGTAYPSWKKLMGSW